MHTFFSLTKTHDIYIYYLVCTFKQLMLAIKYSYRNLYNTRHYDKNVFCSEQYTSAFI